MPRWTLSATPTESSVRCSPKEFFRELRILELDSVSKHENIVDYHALQFGFMSFGPLQISPALVLEEAAHGNLAAFQASVSMEDANWKVRLNLCLDMALGLQVLHEHGLVHGSLDPSHVLIHHHPSRKYLAKICGLGNCILGKEEDVRAAKDAKNPWLSPEQANSCVNKRLAHKVDLFPLGLLMWQALAHQDVFGCFDLPLDAEMRRNECLKIVSMPYLYRFVPFLVEDILAIRLESNDLKHASAVFKQALRLDPRDRNLEATIACLKEWSSWEPPQGPAADPDTRSALSLGEKANQVGFPHSVVTSPSPC